MDREREQGKDRKEKGVKYESNLVSERMIYNCKDTVFDGEREEGIKEKKRGRKRKRKRADRD